MNKNRALVMLLLMVVGQSFAQFEIRKHTINSGGSKISGGAYEVNGSFGVVDSGSQLSGDTYTLNSGFWTENNDLIYKNGLE